MALLFLVPATDAQATICEANGLCWQSEMRPAYPIAFVAADNLRINNSNRYAINFGLDAEAVGSTFWGGFSQLYLFHPDRAGPNQEAPIKVFPLDVHFSRGIIDALPARGVVVEPNASLDGRSVLFGYWHDGSGASSRVRDGSDGRPLGADIYKIDLGPLIDNPSFPPQNLTVTRLTDKQGAINQDAQNRTLADRYVPAEARWKTANIHAIEMMTDQGLRVVYVSDKKRVKLSEANSNLDAFNLFIARYGPDGKLVDDNQFQYFTTSSAISPTNLRNGFSFSYQSSTADGSMWAIQQSDSAGKWGPWDGHGGNHRFAWHLQTLCSTSDPAGDYTVTTVYYRNNNNGAGPLYARPANTAGLNHNLFPAVGGAYFRPQQVGRINITPELPEFQDLPSNYGKFTTPRCGLRDELFASYTWTGGNHKVSQSPPLDPPQYDFHLVFRNGVTAPTSVSAFLKVLDETTNRMSLLWPTPLRSFAERFSQEPTYSFTYANISGMPEALTGTSALYNTDIVPGECRMAGAHYDPTETWGALENHKWVRGNTALLNFVRDPNNIPAVCDNPLPLDSGLIFGMSINQTHTAPDRSSWGHETKRLLGVIPTRNQRNPRTGQPDQSVAALLPSNIPVDFHLLSAQTGLKLADLRSWHSFKPGEVRTECGGCHQHEISKPAVPFAGTYASLPEYPVADLVNTTPMIRYQRGCIPEWFMASGSAKPAVPLWGDNLPLYTKFVNYCGSCHIAGHPSTADEAFAIGTTASETWNALTNETGSIPVRRFIDVEQGAHESPTWWAARGKRADGRKNTGYSRWYTYHSAHDALNLCETDPQWVYDLGFWIDNHAPSSHHFPGAEDYNFDRFHPSVTGALQDITSCAPSVLKAGYWDDTGVIKQLELRFKNCSTNCTVIRENGMTGLPNGFQLFDISALRNSTDAIQVTATDFANNRQTYSKTLEELIYECRNGYDPRNGRALLRTGTGGGGTPDPTPTATRTATPTPLASPTPDSGQPNSNFENLEFSIAPKNAHPGELVTLTISNETLSDSIISIAGSRSGSDPGFQMNVDGGTTQINLNPDDFFIKSSIHIPKFKMSLRKEKIFILIPNKLAEQNVRYTFQAITTAPGTAILRGKTAPKVLEIKRRKPTKIVDPSHSLNKMIVTHKLKLIKEKLRLKATKKIKNLHLRKKAVARAKINISMLTESLYRLRRAERIGEALFGKVLNH